jgi:Na+/phosphate symporter
MYDPEGTGNSGPETVNAGRLWVGGFATAIVAALIVVVGVFITRGILNIPVLAPKAASNFGDSSTAVYAALAAGVTLVATALLHVLLLGAPRPLAFFGWITALADIAVAAAPFTQPASLQSKVFTAVINVVAGVAVISLLTMVARSAARPRPGPRPPVRPDLEHRPPNPRRI